MPGAGLRDREKSVSDALVGLYLGRRLNHMSLLGQ